MFGGDLGAGAGAGIGVACGKQLIERALVGFTAPALVDHLAIGVQTAIGQLPQDGLVGAGLAPRCVHVFDAHQPLAAMGARIQPAGQRGHERAGVQRAGGRGREAADVA